MEPPFQVGHTVILHFFPPLFTRRVPIWLWPYHAAQPPPVALQGIGVLAWGFRIVLAEADLRLHLGSLGYVCVIEMMAEPAYICLCCENEVCRSCIKLCSVAPNGAPVRTKDCWQNISLLSKSAVPTFPFSTQERNACELSNYET